MHRDEMMGDQPDCPHCDPWHERYIDMRTQEEKDNASAKWRRPGSDGWTEAWEASQQEKK
jgi:hypothetical protein